MKRAKFESLTAKEKYEVYKKRQTLFTIFKYVLIALPYLIILIVNFEEYFRNNQGYRVGIGCVVCLGLLVITILGEAGKDLKKKFNGLITMIILFVLSWCFQTILVDLTMILGYGCIGMFCAKVLGVFASRNEEYIKLYREGIIKVEIEKE